jgi:hypothetical protein
MKPKHGMKSRKEDGGACWRQWYRTRKFHLSVLSGPLPKNLCMDQVKLTVYCRYLESLLQNPRISRYLTKYHAEEMTKITRRLAQFKNICDRDAYRYPKDAGNAS